MSTIVLRSVKGTPLTNTEVDTNFSNLNTDKIQIGGTYSSGTANGVLYLNGSKVAATGSGLTFDGTTLSVSALNATTIDLTNLEITNIKAKDGTAGMQIADSTGVVSFTSNPVISGSTANGVFYSSGSKVLTSGSALTFDGANFGVNGANTYQKVLTSFPSTYVTTLSIGGQASITNDGGADEVRFTGAANLSGFFDWYLNGSEQMRLTSTGLGIGTNLPGSKLDVTATSAGNYAARIYNNSATGYGIKIRNGNDSNDALRISNSADTSDNIALYGSGNAYFLGNVGIGTSLPAYKLDVDKGSAGLVARFKGGTRSAYIYSDNDAVYFTSDTSVATAFGVNETSDILTFFTNNAERARISSDGTFRVKGAGTAGSTDAVQFAGSAPASALTLDGSGRLLVGLTSSKDNSCLLQVEGGLTNGGQIYLGNSYTSETSSVVYGQVNFVSNVGSVASTVASILATNDGNHTSSTNKPTCLVFYTTPSGSATRVERARISSDGTFRVKGAGTAGSTDAVQFSGSAPATTLVLDSSGNLGAGTGSPFAFARLTVAGTAGAQTGASQQVVISAPTTTAGQGAGIRFNAASGAQEAVGVIGVVNEASGVSGAMTFHVYNAGADIPEYMRITSAGNVGIGTNNPTNKLTVDGQSNDANNSITGANILVGTEFGLRQRGATAGISGITYSAQIYSSASGGPLEVYTGGSNPLVFGTDTTERMRITGAGNVGIGTNNPQGKLHVSGNNGPLRISGAGYVINPAEFTLGQYTSTRGYLQVPGGNTGQIEIWDGATNNVIVFNAYGVGLYGTAGTSGSGITFPSTQQASSNANTLDDYEEGTWTPTFSPTGASFGAISYTAQLGSYTKIGNVVTVWYRVSVNSVTLGSVSGNLVVTSLPFTVYNASGNYAQGTTDAGNFTTNQPSVHIGIIGSTNIYVYYRSASNASLTAQTAASTANSCYIYGSLTYMTS